MLIGTCRWPLDADQGLQLGDAGGDLDEAQAQGIELDGAPDRAFRHRGAQAPHQPIGASIQERPQLVARGSGARCSVCGEMGSPRLDVVFCLAPPTIDLFIEPAGRAFLEIGDDKARVSALISNFDAGNDPLDAAPAFGTIVEGLEPAHFVRARSTEERGIEARCGAGFQVGDMAAEG